MANAFYESLKASPLAKLDITTEEAAIWIDMHVSESDWLLNAVIAIEERYHSDDDRSSLAIDAMRAMRSVGKSFSSINYTLSVYNQMQCGYFSTAILKSLFKVINETDALDKQASSESFMSYVEEAKHFHAKHICKKMLYTSKRDVDLYEVFAELDGILKAKFTKKCQSPLS